MGESGFWAIDDRGDDEMGVHCKRICYFPTPVRIVFWTALSFKLQITQVMSVMFLFHFKMFLLKYKNMFYVFKFQK